MNHTNAFYSLRNDLSTPKLDSKPSNNFRRNEGITALFQPTAKSNGTWTLPNTTFTPYIEKLVKHFNSKCYNHALLQPNINIFADSSSSIPVVTAYNNNHLVRHNYRIAFMRRLFHNESNRFLPPGNLSFAINGGDNDYGQICAFSSSARNGGYSVFNFQDVRRWSEHRQYPPPLPWDERKTIPIFRGVGWGTLEHIKKIQMELESNIKRGMPTNKAGDIFYKHFIETNDHNQRFALIDFSMQHPNLVDAHLSSVERLRKWHPKDMWIKNATNGLHRLFPVDPIPEEKYYSEYQVHIVMGGIGAAFRTSRILNQGIAIILQKYPFEEWFTHLMVPFVHYIPLEQDLSNLNEILHWVRDNPSKVYDIAMNGKAFHDKYLSYDRMTDFYHELLFRLMLCCGSSEGAIV